MWRFLPAADADEDEAELAELLEVLLLLLVLPPPPELEDDVFPLAPKHDIYHFISNCKGRTGSLNFRIFSHVHSYLRGPRTYPKPLNLKNLNLFVTS